MDTNNTPAIVPEKTSTEKTSKEKTSTEDTSTEKTSTKDTSTEKTSTKDTSTERTSLNKTSAHKTLVAPSTIPISFEIPKTTLADELSRYASEFSDEELQDPFVVAESLELPSDLFPPVTRKGIASDKLSIAHSQRDIGVRLFHLFRKSAVLATQPDIRREGSDISSYSQGSHGQ
jgi:hypothetical protein